MPKDNDRKQGVWKCRGHLLPTDGRPLVMGVINMTPDSFYAGSREPGWKEALALAEKFARDGAAIIDVGGESTRPGAAPVAPEEEEARVVDAIRAIAESTGLPVSVDTRRASVAVAALDAGASIVNDMSSGADSGMAEAVKSLGAGWVLARAASIPAPPRTGAVGGRECREAAAKAADYLASRACAALSAGVARESIALDPGIGFGASPGEDAALLAGIPLLKALGMPVLVGVSRKRFIAEFAGDGSQPEQRLGGSIAAALWAARRGAAVLRVHDVAETVQALAVDRALSACSCERGAVA